MVLQRWYPIADERRIENVLDRFRRGFGRPEYPVVGERTWSVPLDVQEEGDNIVFRASLPGVSPDDIHVATENGVLTIRAETASAGETKESDYLIRERRSGSFYRAVRVPESVDLEKAESSYEHGVLTITLPKEEANKARELEIKVKG